MVNKFAKNIGTIVNNCLKHKQVSKSRIYNARKTWYVVKL